MKQEELRELDKEVHVRVMGLTFKPESSFPWDLVLPYSKDIRCAWDVFEKLREIDPTAMVGGKEVWLDQDSTGPRDVVHGETIEQAICVAALKMIRKGKRGTLSV